jgi:hypothetical protein
MTQRGITAVGTLTLVSCPRLGEAGHGSWYFSLDLPRHVDEGRRRLRVFTDEIGRPLSPDCLTRTFNAMVEGSGLPQATARRRRHPQAQRPALAEITA